MSIEYGFSKIKVGIFEKNFNNSFLQRLKFQNVSLYFNSTTYDDQVAELQKNRAVFLFSCLSLFELRKKIHVLIKIQVSKENWIKTINFLCILEINSSIKNR